MKLNLHVHSTCSDGKKSPKDIALLMEKNNITFALTDHDTISGLEECREALVNKDLLINGMEYSCNLESKNITLHILCYNFDMDLMKKVINIEEKKKYKILKNVYLKLKKLNYDIEVENINKINKTNLADLLVKRGYAENELTAKRGIINKLITDQKNTNVNEAFKNVHNANGKVFWAHPYQVLNKIGKIDIKEEVIEDIIKELIKYNLDGIEVYYRHYTKEQVAFLKSMCDKYKLMYSTGTDIHFKAEDDYLAYDLDEETSYNIYNFIK